MKKLMSITVSGKINQYCFHFYGRPQDLEKWREEGLQIEMVENTIPAWAVKIGLSRIWCKMQDIFNFKFY